LSVDRLLEEPPSWRSRILLEAMRLWAPAMPVSSDWLARVEDLVGRQVGKRVQSARATVVRDREHLTFLAELAVPDAVQLAVGEAATCGLHRIHLHRLDACPKEQDPGSPDIAFIDDADITTPLTVRVWRDGDRMAPLGMHHTRLISDILTDRKVPASRRTLVPVVLSGDEVVWCAGVATSEHFKMTADTRNCLMMVRTDIVPFGRSNQPSREP